MCEFVSWKSFEGKNYFLIDADLETKEGRKLLKPEVIADLCGHGAIVSYYPELQYKGCQFECVDFSSPANFPKEIVKVLKQGKMSRFGIALDMLNEDGRAEYEKIQSTARAEYEKIQSTAWAEYKKIEKPAWAEYKKIEKPAWAEYEKIQSTARAEYEKIEKKEFWKIATKKKYRKDIWK